MSTCLTYQLDEAVLQLSQLVFELTVLSEGSADGGLVALNVLQDAQFVVSLLGRTLRLRLQLLQPRLLLLHQPAQLLVIPNLQRSINSKKQM